MPRKDDIAQGASVFSPRKNADKAQRSVKDDKPASRQADVFDDSMETKWSVRVPQKAVTAIEQAFFDLRKRRIKTTRGALLALCVDKVIPQVLEGKFDDLLRNGAYRTKAQKE